MALGLSVIACAKSFDMSDERLMPLGPDWGVVIGSASVMPVMSAEDNAGSPGETDATYQFDIVQTLPGDPDGKNPNAERYRLKVRAGEERMFISRLRSGRYLVKRFAQERIVGVGGELNLVFDSTGGEVHYIGRLSVEVPQRMSRGKEYRYAVETAREATLSNIAVHHPELAKRAVDAPMRRIDQQAP